MDMKLQIAGGEIATMVTTTDIDRLANLWTFMPKVEVMTLDSLFLHPGFIGYD
jgi:hypothetical protein